jgi:hypothetical protein
MPTVEFYIASGADPDIARRSLGGSSFSIISRRPAASVWARVER